MNTILAQVQAAKMAEIEQSRYRDDDDSNIDPVHPSEIEDDDRTGGPGAGAQVPARARNNGAGGQQAGQGSEGGDPAPPTPSGSSAMEFPEWFPEHLRPTGEEFDYRNAFEQLAGQIASPDFYSGFVDTYREDLMRQAQEIENFKQHFQGFQKDPRNYLKTWLPEFYEEFGARPMSDEEIGAAVEAKLKEEYGDTWADMIDPTEVYRPGTVSRKINTRMLELERQYQNENAKVKERVEARRQEIASGNQGSPAPQGETIQFASADEAAEKTWEQVAPVFTEAGVTKEQYKQFVNENADKQYSMLDIYRGSNYARDVEAARQAGIAEGRRILAKELGVAIKEPEIPPSQPAAQSEQAKRDSRSDYFQKREKLHFTNL